VLKADQNRGAVESGRKKPLVRLLATIGINLSLITAGSVLCAVSVNGILIPQNFISSGVTGMAILISYFFSGLSVSSIYLLLNIPLFLLGWLYVGKRFFIYSVVGLIIFTLALSIPIRPLLLQEPILSSLLAGIIFGGGSGCILRSYGSSGGTDILSIIMMKRFSVKLGTTVLAFNVILLGIAAVMISLESALYALIFLFVSSNILNLVVTGLSQRKSVLIISSKWKEISGEIMNSLNRGITVIHGEGGFSGKRENILYTIIAFQELSRLKDLVRKIDPLAFLVVSDTLEVMGKRIGNQPHW